MNQFFRTLTGPRLYYSIKDSSFDPQYRDIADYNHSKSIIEWLSDSILISYEWAFCIVQYISPFIAISLFKNGYNSSYIKWITSERLFCLAALYFGAYITRGLARVVSNSYQTFINDVIANDDNEFSYELYRNYDFDISSFKVDRKSKVVCQLADAKTSIFLGPLYYLIYEWVARPLAYPGSTYPFNRFTRLQLDNGRLSNFMTDPNNTFRAIVQTSDDFKIDTMFIDKRNRTENGDILVITSEGNAGYYEMGCFEIPRKHGYSTLGWNHPGFSRSTGKPSDRTDANAIEAVYEYANVTLGFPPDKIMLYGWSIGGFPTCYLASRHHDLRGVILDATFHDIKTLARARMPEAIGTLASGVAERYFNLVNGHYITQYPGPIRIIRRSRDEVIGDDIVSPETNHGNNLVKAVLQIRFPGVFDDEEVQGELNNWLAMSSSIQRERNLKKYDIKECEKQLQDYTVDNRQMFGRALKPSDKVMMAYYIFSNIFDDCNSGHNGPLPRDLFKEPWSPNA